MKILIIKPSSFGDIIQANPTLVALKKAYHKAEVSWLVFDKWQGIVKMFSDLDDTIVWKRGLIGFFQTLKKIKEKKFDLVIDLQGLLRSAIIAKMSGAKQVIGVPGMKEFGWIFVKEVHPEKKKINATLRNLETVKYITNKDFDVQFNMNIPNEIEAPIAGLLNEKKVNNSHKLVALVPEARGKGKQWSAGYYNALISLLLSHDQNIRIILLGTGDSHEYSKGDFIVDLRSKTSIIEMAEVLKYVRVVIGGDTGPLHLASALNIQSIFLFGGSDINETSPYSQNSIVISKQYNCSPCRGRPKCKDYPCLQDIKPEEVFEQVKKWVK